MEIIWYSTKNLLEMLVNYLRFCYKVHLIYVEN